MCRACLASEPSFSFAPVSGRGTVRAWTVARTAFLTAFEDELPWVLVDVELAERPGLRLVARLADGPDAPLRLGAPVVVDWEERAEGPAVPCFRLVTP